MDKVLQAILWLGKALACMHCPRRNLCSIEDAFSEYCQELQIEEIATEEGFSWKPKDRLSRVFKGKDVQ